MAPDEMPHYWNIAEEWDHRSCPGPIQLFQYKQSSCLMAAKVVQVAGGKRSMAVFTFPPPELRLNAAQRKVADS
jgi:hypothetical protein